MSKWTEKYTELITAVARNIGDMGIDWTLVGYELEETANAAESAFWRLDKAQGGQASIDARILKHRIRNTNYAKMLPDFPGMTIQDLKDRAAFLAGLGQKSRWVEDEAYRVGHLDIEVYNLDANFGTMLSWSILDDATEEIFSDWIKRDEAIDRKRRDKRLVQSLVDKMAEFDGFITYFGTGFDNPYIRTKALMWDIPFYHYGEKMHYDLFYTVKSKLSLHSKGLAAATEAVLGVTEKTRISNVVWLDANLGYQDALAEVVDHCERDVRDTRRLYYRLRDFVQINKKSF